MSFMYNKNRAQKSINTCYGVFDIATATYDQKMNDFRRMQVELQRMGMARR